MKARSRLALTLIELLVTLAIIAVLIALAAVGIVKLRAAAARAECSNNLKQLGIACHAANHQYKRMPPAFGFYPYNDIRSGAGALGNTFFHLLPFLQQQALYEKSRYRPSSTQNFLFYTANNVHQMPVPAFNCPADPTLMSGINPATQYAPSSYAGNYLVFGNVDANFVNRNAQAQPKLGESFKDGASQTILFVEKYASAWIDADANQGNGYQGGCHWAYFQADCQNPFFAYYEPAPKNAKQLIDPNAVGPASRFQVQPRAAGAATRVCRRRGTRP